MNQSWSESNIPVPIEPGQTLAVVAPAGPVPNDRLLAGLDVLEERYRVQVAPDILRSESYLAGSDQRRAEEFNAALRDPEVRGIAVARGGYGITRILDRLDASALRADPKPIIGFSDATALLCWSLCAGVRPIHGPVVTQLGEVGAQDRAAYFDALEGEPTMVSPVDAIDPLWGGNLCVLASMMGTKWAPALPGTLVLEDIGERPYRLDRFITQLHLAGALANVSSVWLGGFTSCDEEDLEGASVVKQCFRALGIDVRSGARVGHGNRNRAFHWGPPPAGLAEGTRV